MSLCSSFGRPYIVPQLNSNMVVKLTQQEGTFCSAAQPVHCLHWQRFPARCSCSDIGSRTLQIKI